MLGIIIWILLLVGGIIAANALSGGLYQGIKAIQQTGYLKEKSQKTHSKQCLINISQIYYFQKNFITGIFIKNNYTNVKDMKN